MQAKGIPASSVVYVTGSACLCLSKCNDIEQSVSPVEEVLYLSVMGGSRLILGTKLCGFGHGTLLGASGDSKVGTLTPHLASGVSTGAERCAIECLACAVCMQ